MPPNGPSRRLRAHLSPGSCPGRCPAPLLDLPRALRQGRPVERQDLQEEGRRKKEEGRNRGLSPSFFLLPSSFFLSARSACAACFVQDRQIDDLGDLAPGGVVAGA